MAERARKRNRNRRHISVRASTRDAVNSLADARGESARVTLDEIIEEYLDAVGIDGRAS